MINLSTNLDPLQIQPQPQLHHSIPDYPLEPYTYSSHDHDHDCHIESEPPYHQPHQAQYIHYPPLPLPPTNLPTPTKGKGDSISEIHGIYPFKHAYHPHQGRGKHQHQHQNHRRALSSETDKILELEEGLESGSEADGDGEREGGKMSRSTTRSEERERERENEGDEQASSYPSYPSSLSCSPPPPYRGADAEQDVDGRERGGEGEMRDGGLDGEGEADSPGRRSVSASELSSSMCSTPSTGQYLLPIMNGHATEADQAVGKQKILPPKLLVGGFTPLPTPPSALFSINTDIPSAVIPSSSSSASASASASSSSQLQQRVQPPSPIIISQPSTSSFISSSSSSTISLNVIATLNGDSQLLCSSSSTSSLSTNPSPIRSDFEAPGAGAGVETCSPKHRVFGSGGRELRSCLSRSVSYQSTVMGEETGSGSGSGSKENEGVAMSSGGMTPGGKEGLSVRPSGMIKSLSESNASSRPGSRMNGSSGFVQTGPDGFDYEDMDATPNEAGHTTTPSNPFYKPPSLRRCVTFSTTIPSVFPTHPTTMYDRSPHPVVPRLTYRDVLELREMKVEMSLVTKRPTALGGPSAGGGGLSAGGSGGSQDGRASPAFSNSSGGNASPHLRRENSMDDEHPPSPSALTSSFPSSVKLVTRLNEMGEIWPPARASGMGVRVEPGLGMDRVASGDSLREDFKRESGSPILGGAGHSLRRKTSGDFAVEESEFQKELRKAREELEAIAMREARVGLASSMRYGQNQKGKSSAVPIGLGLASQSSSPVMGSGQSFARGVGRQASGSSLRESSRPEGYGGVVFTDSFASTNGVPSASTPAMVAEPIPLPTNNSAAPQSISLNDETTTNLSIAPPSKSGILFASSPTSTPIIPPPSITSKAPIQTKNIFRPPSPILAPLARSTPVPRNASRAAAAAANPAPSKGLRPPSPIMAPFARSSPLGA